MKKGTLIPITKNSSMLKNELLKDLRTFIKTDECQKMLLNFLKEGGFDKIDTSEWKYPKVE
jgi:hypothetical protein